MPLKLLRRVLAPLGILLAIVLTRIYLQPIKSPSSFVYFISPSPYLEYFTFGYRELIADMLWLRVIQDLDECDRPVGDNQLCSNSWVYKMVDKVTDLSPQFRMIYATVPLVLALSVNDPEGALRLQEKGMRYFPKDWPILYRGGYLYLFAGKDKVKAAQYFLSAQKNGGPDWLASLATRLYTESGRVDLARQLVNEYKSSGIPPGILKRMEDRILEASKKLSR